MPYSDPAKQTEYQRQWMAKRRADWFEGKVCVECGAAGELDLDHKDPKKKVSHRIWSWSEERRLAELAKCRPLCIPCHEKKTTREMARGEQSGRSKLTEVMVREILVSSLSGAALARKFGVQRDAVSCVRLGKTWQHIQRDVAQLG
jgi:hypothetical protein